MEKIMHPNSEILIISYEEINGVPYRRDAIDSMTGEIIVTCRTPMREGLTETTMVGEKIVSWNEAIESGNFIKLEEDKPVSIVIANWKLVEAEKEFNGKKEVKVEFQSTATECNGEKCEKEFNTVSNRLKLKLKAVLENKEPSTPVKLRITKVGDKFNTNYSVVEE